MTLISYLYPPMNIKAISSNVGKALLVNALFMLLSIIVSAADGMDEAFSPLLISFLITSITGIFPFIFVRHSQENSTKDGYITIVLAWLMSFIVGMLPYILYGGEFTLVNAWFESVSGYTTTGSTILTNIEDLPRSLLFWRSSTHFIGGLGVVVFLLLILPDASSFKFRLSDLEVSTLSRYGYRYRRTNVPRIMLSVYIGLTVIEILLLMLAGMSFFDAVNHSFSTMATGGFSTRNASIMHYDSPVIDIIIIVFMTLASMHFGVIYAMLVRRSFAPVKNSVTKYYLKVIMVFSLFITLILMFQGGYSSFGKALLDSVFQVVSFISTTGFGNADNALWPALANVFLILAALHCGCSGSTTGGLKADRMLIVFKEIGSEFKRRLHPSSVIRTKVDGHSVNNDQVAAVFLYVVAYAFILFILFIAALISGADISDAFSGTLASLGNVGPGLDGLGTMGNYASQPVFAKLIYTAAMFLGRLEIFPVLAVLNLAYGSISGKNVHIS
ncbi:MAG: TrkH family potassium uptake protein [Bacteroidales bacterium]|nr:TrkH family potassium uptake protein [Bacteroidales bacterium]